jgi:hypothetical protein
VWPLAEDVLEDSLPDGLRTLFKEPGPLSATSYREAEGPNELDHIDGAGIRVGCVSAVIGVGALFTCLLTLQQHGRVPEEWAGVGEYPATWRTTAFLVLAVCITLFGIGHVVRDLWVRRNRPPGRYGIFLLHDTFVLRTPLRPVRCAVIPRDATVHIRRVHRNLAGRRRSRTQLQYWREDWSTRGITLDGLTSVPISVLVARLQAWRA